MSHAPSNLASHIDSVCVTGFAAREFRAGRALPIGTALTWGSSFLLIGISLES